MLWLYHDIGRLLSIRKIPFIRSSFSVISFTISYWTSMTMSWTETSSEYLLLWLERDPTRRSELWESPATSIARVTHHRKTAWMTLCNIEIVGWHLRLQVEALCCLLWKDSPVGSNIESSVFRSSNFFLISSICLGLSGREGLVVSDEPEWRPGPGTGMTCKCSACLLTSELPASGWQSSRWSRPAGPASPPRPTRPASALSSRVSSVVSCHST